jgi:3-hydroxybutyryl-CoA dehydratase
MISMSRPLYFDELNVGDSWQSRARTITEADVVNFACLTGDFDPLHVDHEYARQTPFRKPIAHGLLGLSWMAGLSTTAPWVKTAAFVAIRDWRFLQPAFISDTVHVVTEVAELAPRGRRRGLVVWKRRLVNQQGIILQEGVLETLVEVAPKDKAPAEEAP